MTLTLSDTFRRWFRRLRFYVMQIDSHKPILSYRSTRDVS